MFRSSGVHGGHWRQRHAFYLVIWWIVKLQITFQVFLNAVCGDFFSDFYLYSETSLFIWAHWHTPLTHRCQICLMSKAWRIVILQPYTNSHSVRLISQEWWFKKKKKNYAVILPNQHLEVMCPFQLDYLSRSFWSLLGKSVPLSHGISSIFDQARVYLEVRRPWPDEINGQIGFFPWSPWKKTIKQQGDLERPLCSSQPIEHDFVVAAAVVVISL